MHIIPVIDVRHGIAVHAVAGERANYRPLRRGAHADGSDPLPTPVAIAQAYRALFPFPTIYLADLDAIEGREAPSSAQKANVKLVQELAVAVPDVSFWIDAGRTCPEPSAAHTTVIGSEALRDHDLDRAIPETAVLSLDFRGEEFLGPLALLARPDLWPSRVIVMTLARVGTNDGPDLARIADIARRAPKAQIYAAGGVRDVTDLKAARAAGAVGALLASALHAEKIKADDLDEIIGL